MLTERPAPLLQEIMLNSILSFGPDSAPLQLQNLNVLIGPNGSGKSNLIEAIGLLKSTTTDCRPVISRGGGVKEWIWKGRPSDHAAIEVVVSNSAGGNRIEHCFAFRNANQLFRIILEQVRVGGDFSNPRYEFSEASGASFHRQLNPMIQMQSEIDPQLSILAQRRDPTYFPEITRLAAAYDKIALYREWTFGRSAVCRQPQRADERSDRLAEDFSNLGMFLNRLRRDPRAKAAVLAGLRDLYEGLTDFDVIVEGGTVQVFFTEGEFAIPATRLSDGTIRYLCLLAILCDPEPPPLICIEEPELGMHPDLIPKIADLLVDASTRTQLIVTTHSDILVDSLTETPECIIVCEKLNGQTEMSRLNPDDLKVWLENYTLGTLWIKGQLGGKRW